MGYFKTSYLPMKSEILGKFKTTLNDFHQDNCFDGKPLLKNFLVFHSILIFPNDFTGKL